jgi:hypothetical protein
MVSCGENDMVCPGASSVRLKKKRDEDREKVKQRILSHVAAKKGKGRTRKENPKSERKRANEALSQNAFAERQGNVESETLIGGVLWENVSAQRSIQ